MLVRFLDKIPAICESIERHKGKEKARILHVLPWVCIWVLPLTKLVSLDRFYLWILLFLSAIICLSHWLVSQSSKRMLVKTQALKRRLLPFISPETRCSGKQWNVYIWKLSKNCNDMDISTIIEMWQPLAVKRWAWWSSPVVSRLY